jgi:enoyl-CoA hydratase/carnithine racemase
MDNIISSIHKNGTLIIELNRPTKKNALTSHMYQTLTNLFTDANKDKTVKCILITGDENCFTAGNDLGDFLAHQQSDDTLPVVAFIKALTANQKPLVAATAGAAVGIGTTLLLHCDYVVAAETTLFKLPFCQLGLCPEAGSSKLLPQLVGQRMAFELLVLGRSFNAQEAKAFGIVNTICLAHTLFDSAMAVCNDICRLPSDAVITSKALMKNSSNISVASTVDEELTAFFRLLATDESKTIIQRFFQ